MIVVPITFKYVQIAKYSRDGAVLHIVFSDGSKDLALERSADYGNVEEFTNKVIEDVRTAVKQKNQQNSSEVLGNVVAIRFTEDEEELFERLAIAFGRIKEEIRKAKTAKTAQNYLQTISNLQGAVFNLN
ncbi:hypothetical protein JXB27_02410 [Candidatus Woesearchaeota archaeon]|nr:hypothetical protein [Candidatus Woesearchaeota archaeon]